MAEQAPFAPQRGLAPRSTGWYLVAVLAVGAVFLAACRGNQGEGAFNQGDATTPDGSVPAAVPPATLLTLEKTGDARVEANGEAVTDANGVSVQIAPEALAADSGNGRALVTTAAMVGPMADALSRHYRIDSPVYTIEAEGRQDATGRATLVFPAPSADSRLVQIIDDQYLAPVNTQPTDGKLTFYARMGPADTQGLDPAGSLRFDGSQRFLVITPKRSGRPWLAPGRARAEAVPGVDCTVVGTGLADEARVSPCHANEDKTVKVHWVDGMSFTDTEAYKVAKEAEKWMKVYAGKDIGLRNADLSRYWFAMNIVIQAGSGDPQYSPKSGAIYMPMDFAKSIGSGPGAKSLLHELAHWIQDESYKMCWAGLKSLAGANANWWWLEVAAENMVMLAQPDAMTANMITYGSITSADNALVWQKAINQWPADFYAHAHLVKVFMCDSDACPLSEKSFVAAINQGTYPYGAASALTKIGANLEDYARYLIGGKPQRTNSAISLDAVSAGGTFGEGLLVGKKVGKSLSFLGNKGRKPQIDEKTEDGFDRLDFNAPLEQNGVYPITINSNDRYVGMPVMLTVDAGIPVVYRLDGGEIKTHVGDKPLIVGPISATLGYKELRLAAYSSASGMSFKGSLRVIDLTGAWALSATTRDKPTSSTVVCDNPPKEGTDEMYLLLPLFGNVAMSMGDFKPVGSPDKLEWTFLPKRLPPQADAGDFTQDYSMAITPDAITIKGSLDIPKKQATLPSSMGGVAGQGGLPLGAIGLAGGLWWVRRRSGKRRGPTAAGIALTSLALLLAGCIGFFGHSDVEIKVTRLEASNGNTDATWNVSKQLVPDTVPIWTITKASGSFKIDSTTSSDAANPFADQAVTVLNHCKGTMAFDLKGGVYPDITLSSEE